MNDNELEDLLRQQEDGRYGKSWETRACNPIYPKNRPKTHPCKWCGKAVKKPKAYHDECWVAHARMLRMKKTNG